jgi:hypothetical protein
LTIGSDSPGRKQQIHSGSTTDIEYGFAAVYWTYRERVANARE